MKLKNLLKFLLILGLLFFIAVEIPRFSFAKTSQEIGQEIEDKKNQLEETNQQIQDLEEQIKQSEETINNAQSGMPKIQAEIDKINAELQLNEEKLSLLQKQLELKGLEKEEKQARQQRSLKYAYKDWRVKTNPLDTFTGESYSKFRNDQYASIVLDIGKNQIVELGNEIDELDKESQDYESTVEALSLQNEQLLQEKMNLEGQIAYYSNLVGQNTSLVGDLSLMQGSIINEINGLYAEQQVAAAREAELLRKTQNQTPVIPPKDNNPSVPGTFYFSGRGRDMYQGHGVGYSQFGAYGAANSGMTAEQILKFYYTGVELSTATGDVTLVDQGITLNVEDYLTHLGEVPDKACGTQEQVAENPSKYALYNPDVVWTCWPEEAIKSQIIAARTYALNHKNLYSDARSQVYDTAYNKTWAQQETNGQVIMYQGQIIEALYSADNNQGYGSANNDTVFQDIEGNGTEAGYLRSVDDNAFAKRTNWTDWTYSTFNYTYGSVEDMLKFIAEGDSGFSDSERQKIQGILTELNGISGIELERDPSQRVKKVWLIGQSGARRSIGGWWFKNMWNTWAYATGSYDYIFSITLYINQN